MQIKISEAQELASKILPSLGFSKEQTALTVRNLIDAEVHGKSSHGLVRIPAIKSQLEKGTVKLVGDYEVMSDTSNSLYINGHDLPGAYLLYKSLELSIPKAKETNMVTVGIKDSGYSSGFIGSYALEATRNDLIFIGFNNSPGWTVPFGSTKGAWGTNPITIGIPAHDAPVIYDSAMTQITIGEILVARNTGAHLQKGAALDTTGEPTTDPEAAYEAKSVLPIAEHKGSGLALMVELLAVALTGSRVGGAVPGAWGGTTYILINPAIFRPIAEFKADVDLAINELKGLPKAKGAKEIYYPGEQSMLKKALHEKNGVIDVPEQIWNSLNQMA